jgi:hypothetical protein
MAHHNTPHHIMHIELRAYHICTALVVVPAQQNRVERIAERSKAQHEEGERRRACASLGTNDAHILSR